MKILGVIIGGLSLVGFITGIAHGDPSEFEDQIMIAVFALGVITGYLFFTY